MQHSNKLKWDVRSIVLLLVASCVAISVLVVGLWALSLESARWVQSYLGYFACLLGSILCGRFGFQVWSRRRLADAFCGRQALLFAVLISIVGSYFMFLNEPLAMRVFNDEPGHAMAAEAMAQERGVFTFGQGRFEGGGLVYADPTPVYRMYYYSFVVSLVHNLTGPRMLNLYLVNMVVTFVLLMVSFKLGTLIGGIPIADQPPPAWTSGE